MNHDGQRQRIRKKFITGSHLEDHEILEIVLFSSIHRCNTNEIAHELLNRFGSLRGVFDAGFEALQEVEGIGPSSALQLRLISECITRYSLQVIDTRALLNRREALEEYLRALFIGCDHEKAVILFFNNTGRLLTSHTLAEGTVNLLDTSTRELLSLATKLGASAAVLVHNHPDGLSLPSDKDLAATLRISRALESVSVTLIDHFIVSSRDCRPILYYREGKYAEKAPDIH